MAVKKLVWTRCGFRWTYVFLLHPLFDNTSKRKGHNDRPKSPRVFTHQMSPYRITRVYPLLQLTRSVAKHAVGINITHSCHRLSSSLGASLIYRTTCRNLTQPTTTSTFLYHCLMSITDEVLCFCTTAYVPKWRREGGYKKCRNILSGMMRVLV